MTIRTIELWPGHRITLVLVRRARRWHIRFNERFARASRPHEYAILAHDDPIVRQLLGASWER